MNTARIVAVGVFEQADLSPKASSNGSGLAVNQVRARRKQWSSNSLTSTSKCVTLLSGKIQCDSSGRIQIKFGMFVSFHRFRSGEERRRSRLPCALRVEATSAVRMFERCECQVRFVPGRTRTTTMQRRLSDRSAPAKWVRYVERC
jgi:hypothetical protein